MIVQPRPRARPAVGGYLTMALAVAVMVLPLVWMALASFKGMDEIYRLPIQWLPESFAPTNYGTATQTVPFGMFFVNSAITTVLGAGFKMLLGLMTAYALVFIDIPFRRLFFYVVVCALLVPQQIVLIPNYALVAQLGWQWRGKFTERLLRVGVQYLTGPSPQYQFFRDSEENVLALMEERKN
jgi:sn-glycerol 3-phosphate transport system permease protein